MGGLKILTSFKPVSFPQWDSEIQTMSKSQIQMKSTLVLNIQEQWNLSFPVQNQTVHTTLFK